MRANIPSDKKGGDFLSREISRREFLRNSNIMICILGGLKLTSGCATPDFQKKESAADLQASQNRDSAIDNIYKINLGVRQNEKVLVFTDDHSLAIMREAEYVAKRGAKFAQIVFQQYPKTGLSGAEPPKALWEKVLGKNTIEEIEKRKLFRKLLEKKIGERELESIGEIVRQNKQDVVQVVIGLAWYSTSHTSFRKLLTNYAGVRYASMPAFDPRMWQTAMLANWEEVDRRTNSLQQRVSGATSARVRTPYGTNVSVVLEGREFKADTGLLTHPGQTGNLPAGELLIAPVEGKANGMMVIEPGINPFVKGEVIFEIKDGMVSRVKGEMGHALWLESIFQKNPLARNIAEFAIGTNEKAQAGTTMLEIEKILGTAHIAIGDNSTIGGKTLVPVHLDYLLRNPTVEFTFPGGKMLEVLKEGKVLW